MTEWKPIETALDGVPVLAIDADGTIAVVVGPAWFDPLYDMAGLGNPTHWMPLPDRPQK